MEIRCNGAIPGWTRTRNRTWNLDLLLTLSWICRFQSPVLICGFLYYGHFLISYWYVQNIDFDMLLSVFVVLATFLIKMSCDMLPATTCTWASMECHRYFILHQEYDESYGTVTLQLRPSISLTRISLHLLLHRQHLVSWWKYLILSAQDRKCHKAHHKQKVVIWG